MSSTIVDEKTWPMIDHDFGEPFWPRWVGEVLAARLERGGQAGEPLGALGRASAATGRRRRPVRAAATARSMSAGEASGTCPMTSSVCGEMTSIRSPVFGRHPLAADEQLLVGLHRLTPEGFEWV